MLLKVVESRVKMGAIAVHFLGPAFFGSVGDKIQGPPSCPPGKQSEPQPLL